MDFIRIIPVQRFTGQPAPAHRPYAFYSDGFSLHGRTIADCYRLVKGLDLPPNPLPGYQKERRTPFVWAPWTLRDPDAPPSRLGSSASGDLEFSEAPRAWFDETKYVVIGATLRQALGSLDPLPATWRALAYIVSDRVRMRATNPLSWELPVVDFASARVHERFREIQARCGRGLLAEDSTKKELGLEDFDKLPEPAAELKYYQYLSEDSGFTNDIVELFGISHRCWHGCGYIGWPGFPTCRLFLLRNEFLPGMTLEIRRGKERFLHNS
jgi:hypothetical protein